jgi:D-alanyl-D-alanine carboxypeptidase
MKRFFIFILTAVLLLSLSSCFMLPDVESMEWAVLTVPEGGANKGDLVIANTSNAAVIPAPEEQASIAEMQSQHTPAIYQNSGLSTHMDKDALTALGHMLTDFNHAQKVSDVQIQYAYVSADSLGTLPADHLTGLGCELKYTTVEEDGTIVVHDLSESSVHGWLAENCHKYGFVVRYPADKASVTGISDYTDYFRYVGPVHASYMRENNLCLEEYVSLLKDNYNRNEPLNVYLDGVLYQVFYADVTQSSTVMYPAYHSVTYSGTGEGGVIVVMQA